MTKEELAKLETARKKTNPESLRQRAIAYLSLAQLERLEQISNQQAAPFLLNSPSAASRIGASPQQIQRVQDIQKQEFNRHQRLLRPLVDEHFADVKNGSSRWSEKRARQRDHKMEELGREYLQRCRNALLDVLTPEQEARWKALLGAPFTQVLTYDMNTYPTG